MASSSLSQESLDPDELHQLSRRSRVKVGIRCRAPYAKHESIETTDDRNDMDDLKVEDFLSPSCPSNTMAVLAGEHMLGMSPGSLFIDHESPTRSKFKDKRWPGHPTHKAKPMVKDKRKFREKRRSCGLVHMQSTESTGDSLDENELRDTVNVTSSNVTTVTANVTTVSASLTTPNRCNNYNEVIDADNPQTPEEDRKTFNSRTARNKSPSDLDADLEDNQDYDSTVSQTDVGCSRTNSSTKFPTLPPLFSSQNEGMIVNESEIVLDKINNELNSGFLNYKEKLDSDDKNINLSTFKAEFLSNNNKLKSEVTRPSGNNYFTKISNSNHMNKFDNKVQNDYSLHKKDKMGLSSTFHCSHVPLDSSNDLKFKEKNIKQESMVSFDKISLNEEKYSNEPNVNHCHNVDLVNKLLIVEQEKNKDLQNKLKEKEELINVLQTQIAQLSDVTINKKI